MCDLLCGRYKKNHTRGKSLDTENHLPRPSLLFRAIPSLDEEVKACLTRAVGYVLQNLLDLFVLPVFHGVFYARELELDEVVWGGPIEVVVRHYPLHLFGGQNGRRNRLNPLKIFRLFS